MADQVLTFKIPEMKVAIALEGFLKIYPNIELNEDETPKYTNAEWVKEKIRRLVIRDIHRGLQMIETELHIVPIDDNIITTI